MPCRDLACFVDAIKLTQMAAELTIIIEPAMEGGFWAICPEFPGANGQGETIAETKEHLIAAIALLLQDQTE